MESAPPPIPTKVLLPSRRPTLLHRARLVDFIHEHIDRKMILVSAAAGYGKTSLLTDYCQEAELPICWLALDEGDCHLPMFAHDLVASIQHRFPTFGRRTQELLRSGRAALTDRALVSTLCSDMLQDIPSYFVVALDDYHLVDESAPVNVFLDLLLRHLPEHCHIILSSRTLPTKLTITRLVARQEIAGLGVSDLRFTAEEIQALTRQNYDQELSDEDAKRLAEHSEGWITGLLLSTHDLWRGLFRDMILVRGDEGQVFDFLANEVFAKQPEERQRFLLDTSILDEMDTSLCNALLGIEDADAILQSLINQNLFISQLEKGWYRYHHLFRSYLRERAKTSASERYRTLQAKAATLLSERHLLPEAITLYLSAGLLAEGAAAIQRATDGTWERGQWERLSQWIDAIPPELLPEYPWLPHYRGKIYAEGGELEEARAQFRIAKSGFSATGDDAGMARTLVEEGFVWNNMGDYGRAEENSRKALQMLQEGERLFLGRAHRALGTAYVMSGRAQEAIAELTIALSLYERLDRPYDIALVHHDLGLAHWRTGEMGRSKFHLEQALKNWERVNNLAGIANTLNSLGVIRHSEGDYAGALETLEQALDSVRKAVVPLTEAYILASIGDLYRELGEHERALASYEQALGIGKRRDLAFVTLYSLLSMGIIHCLDGSLDAASYYIEQSGEIAREHDSRYNLGLHQIAYGMLLSRQGRLVDSGAVLSEAVDMFSASGTKIELVRAKLQLAQVLINAGQHAQATNALEEIVEAASQLESHQFIVAEGRIVPAVIQYAIEHDIGDGFFQRIADELRTLVRTNITRPDKGAEPASPPTAMLEAFALGEARVLLNGKAITNAEWGAATAKELFFYLLDRPEGARKDQIIEAFWPEVSSSKGNSRFHSTTYRIRKALHPDALVRENGLYRLDLRHPYAHDAAEFERAVVAARNASTPAERAVNYGQAADLYSGDYMADSDLEWADQRREHLRQALLEALHALAQDRADKQEYQGCIEIGLRLLDLEPFDESTYRQLMLCHSELGNRHQALEIYRSCADLLRDELGVAPSSETKALFDRIRHGGL